jgi:hypothetical protein
VESRVEQEGSPPWSANDRGRFHSKHFGLRLEAITTSRGGAKDGEIVHSCLEAFVTAVLNRFCRFGEPKALLRPLPGHSRVPNIFQIADEQFEAFFFGLGIGATGQCKTDHAALEHF